MFHFAFSVFLSSFFSFSFILSLSFSKEVVQQKDVCDEARVDEDEEDTEPPWRLELESGEGESQEDEGGQHENPTRLKQVERGGPNVDREGLRPVCERPIEDWKAGPKALVQDG